MEYRAAWYTEPRNKIASTCDILRSAIKNLKMANYWKPDNLSKTIRNPIKLSLAQTTICIGEIGKGREKEKTRIATSQK